MSRAYRFEIGLGPLHTVFDDKGFGYTSVFTESTVAKWSPPEAIPPVHPRTDPSPRTP